ncbi:hypothetical protein GCM10027447_05880 [Glycomyces halotolerans]
MSMRRDFETEAARALREASAEYGDLPLDVADRLDRVLEQLPTADTLHARAETAPSWGERIRSKRVRYALVSAAAAILVTIGGVGVAVQYFAATGAVDSATTAQDGAGDAGAGLADDEAGAARSEEIQSTDEELAAPEGAEETTGVETFSTGGDYADEPDLLAALRGLGDASADGEVPEELQFLARGGPAWENCREAIAERYDSLMVAVDFAWYDDEPAVVVLLVSDSGEIAVAVTAECAQGRIVELTSQR